VLLHGQLHGHAADDETPTMLRRLISTNATDPAAKCSLHIATSQPPDARQSTNQPNSHQQPRQHAAHAPYPLVQHSRQFYFLAENKARMPPQDQAASPMISGDVVALVTGPSSFALNAAETQWVDKNAGASAHLVVFRGVPACKFLSQSSSFSRQCNAQHVGGVDFCVDSMESTAACFLF
jgi:hypothetical protein